MQISEITLEIRVPVCTEDCAFLREVLLSFGRSESKTKLAACTLTRLLRIGLTRTTGQVDQG
jgi:hypothetical protein